MRRLAPLLALFLGCSSAPTSTPPPTSTPTTAPSTGDETPSGEPLRDRLIKAAAEQTAFIVATDAAIVVRTADRTLETLLPHGAEASYNERYDLIFYRSGDELGVIDLRASAPRGVALVSGVPDVPVVISGAVHDSIGRGAPEVLQLEWSKSPTVTVDLTFGEVMNEDRDEAIKKAVVVGAAWLTAQLDREPRSEVSTSAPSKRSTGPTTACDDEEICGEAAAFGTGGWELYVSRHQCGDYCHTDCLLFDPATRRIAAPAATPRWVAEDKIDNLESSCGPFLFDGAQTTFASGNQVCSLGGACSDLGGVVLGTLEPSVIASVGI